MEPGATIETQLIAVLPRLRRFARALCGSTVAADDLVHAVCVRVLANSESWAPGTRFDAWIFRILRNQWIDWSRRQKTEGHVDPIEDVDIAGDDGEVRALSTVLLAQVNREIAALPREQQEVLLLVCIEDLSYREVAEILDVPIGTVMSRLARARKRLIELTQAA